MTREELERRHVESSPGTGSGPTTSRCARLLDTRQRRGVLTHGFGGSFRRSTTSCPSRSTRVACSISLLEGSTRSSVRSRGRACSGSRHARRASPRRTSPRKLLGCLAWSSCATTSRNLSVERYGEFDVIICSGILYHLDTPDVFHLVNRTSEMARRLVVIDTHASLKPNVTVEFRGSTYYGSGCPRATPLPTAQRPGHPVPVNEGALGGSRQRGELHLLAAVAAECARGGRLLVSTSAEPTAPRPAGPRAREPLYVRGRQGAGGPAAHITGC